MNKRNVIFFLFLLMGLGLLNYPFVSQWVNQRSQSRAVTSYEKQTQQTPNEALAQMLEDARAYNSDLAQSQQQLTDGFTWEQPLDQRYMELLNPGGDGVMGYIQIPSIQVQLPIYHGTTVDTLENGVGHLVQSSLPVGGADTHAVLSAHTGLATKALFTDLDQLQTGDLFTLHILDQELTYEVCSIETVLPYETESLAIVPGQDLVTLVTCTPYGINSHRLLVTGQRTENLPAQEETAAPAQTTVKTGKWKWGEIIFVGSVLILLVSGLVLLRPDKKGGKPSHG